jgi:hypothetical protein
VREVKRAAATRPTEALTVGDRDNIFIKILSIITAIDDDKRLDLSSNNALSATLLNH